MQPADCYVMVVVIAMAKTGNDAFIEFVSREAVELRLTEAKASGQYKIVSVVSAGILVKPLVPDSDDGLIFYPWQRVRHIR